MPFAIVRQDITRMEVDAIVNAANTDLAAGGGVCGAIFGAAGRSDMQEACDRLAPIRTGEAVLTPGFALPARYVIHAAGPVYHRWKPGLSRRYLYAAYENSLRLAAENGCESIAFPLISSGIYGYPKEEALKVATEAITRFLEDQEMDVYLAVFDKAAFQIGRKLQGAVESYIDEHYVESREDSRRGLSRVLEDASPFQMPTSSRMSPSPQVPPSAAPARMPTEISSRMPASAPPGMPPGAPPQMPPSAALSRMPASVANSLPASESLEDMIGNLDEPFGSALLRLIDAKGKTDVEVYKRANIDRRLFSKIRTGQGYMPSKRTALALSVALELSLKETGELLGRAGYALSHSQKFDVIVEYFIIHKKYNIYEINEVLFAYDQPLLGG